MGSVLLRLHVFLVAFLSIEHAATAVAATLRVRVGAESFRLLLFLLEYGFRNWGKLDEFAFYVVCVEVALVVEATGLFRGECDLAMTAGVNLILTLGRLQLAKWKPLGGQ